MISEEVTMNKPGINSVMLDTSYCIRLMDNTDSLHANAIDYYKYFLQEKITIHISTIVIAEYAVVDDPNNLPLTNLQIEAFDYIDGKVAGNFHALIRGNKSNIAGFNRRIIANDVKILAQISNKQIESIISKDTKSISEYINPLSGKTSLQLKFIDLNIPLNQCLGQLFV